MVFSSFPTFPDPSNWQQQSITTTVGITGNNNQQFIPTQPLQTQPQLHHLPPPPLPHGGGGGGGSGSSIRPGSMAERARLANIPMPETALKCPRCESTNTKFCYFNNYSLSQPRHFCKTCRRYWTRNGALRNVPVGGGCRRNKRTKNGGGSSSSNNNSTSSKSQDNTATTNPMGLSSILSSYNTGIITGHDHILGLGSSLPSLKLMAPLDPHHDFTNTDNFTFQYGTVSGSSVHHHPELTAFQMGSSSSGGASGLLSGFEQWRFPATQLPLLGGLEISPPSVSSGLYPFDPQTGMDPGYGVTGSGHFRPKNMFHGISLSSSSSNAAATAAMVTAAASQLASVKVEDNNSNNQDLSRQIIGNSEQFWNVSVATTSSWSDVSNFSSSSTSNPL